MRSDGRDAAAASSPPAPGAPRAPCWALEGQVWPTPGGPCGRGCARSCGSPTGARGTGARWLRESGPGREGAPGHRWTAGEWLQLGPKCREAWAARVQKVMGTPCRLEVPGGAHQRAWLRGPEALLGQASWLSWGQPTSTHRCWLCSPITGAPGSGPRQSSFSSPETLAGPRTLGLGGGPSRVRLPVWAVHRQRSFPWRSRGRA